MSTHAVVIGASMAGLMAAGVLASTFDQVTVIERDLLPDGPALRKGVPQGAHAHTLLIRGKEILEEVFPGLTADLLAHGAVVSDSSAQVCWFQYGVFKGRNPTGLMITAMTRPLLEWRTRTHLQKLPNVRLLQGHRVTGLIAAAGRVAGVTAEPVDRSGGEQRLNADLVVEAGGRGTRAPQWLADLGYGPVPAVEVKTNVSYASRLFRLPGAQPDYNLCVITEECPGTRAGILFKVEEGRWLLTLQTMLDDQAPADDEGFLAFVRSLPRPQVAEFVERAVPDSEIISHRTPSNLRRHYEQMARFPDGLVIMGDASTSFNPRYGQGMTTAALGAAALQLALRQGDWRAPGFASGFQKALAKAIAEPWMASTGEDYVYPQVEGKRPPGARLMNWYMRRIVRLTSIDDKKPDQSPWPQGLAGTGPACGYRYPQGYFVLGGMGVSVGTRSWCLYVSSIISRILVSGVPLANSLITTRVVSWQICQP